MKMEQAACDDAAEASGLLVAVGTARQAAPLASLSSDGWQFFSHGGPWSPDACTGTAAKCTRRPTPKAMRACPP